MKTTRCLPFLAAALVIGAPLTAERVQSPDAAWRTITQPHYRIHYPDRPEFASFAIDVASRVEGLHTLLEKWVGHALPGPTDILIQNPMAAANGFAVSRLRPHIVLWTQGPESDTALGNASEWVELLLTHELVHLHQLTTPNRKGELKDGFFKWMGLSALSRKSPTWVKEGYATLLEGLLTGQGRPHGAARAAELREKARAGLLPKYEELNEQSGTPYLFGSAFLEWIIREKAQGKKTPEKLVLQELWKRLSSSRYPDFDAAFIATFGESPRAAYGRFSACLSHGALEVETQLKVSGLQEGELWNFMPDSKIQNLSISPDGKWLMGLVKGKKKAGIHVWDLSGKDEKAEKAKAKVRAKDPELPEEVRVERPEIESKHYLASPYQFSSIEKPTWDAKGEICFQHRVSNEEGVFQLRENAWDAFGKKKEAAGEVKVVMLHPRLQEGRWVIDVQGKALPLPFHPVGPLAWVASSQEVFASSPVDGISNLLKMKFDPTAPEPFGKAEQLTRVVGEAAYPAPSLDLKALYFVHRTALGSEIRRLDLTVQSVKAASPVQQTIFAPHSVISKPNEVSLTPAPGVVPPSQAYAVGDSHKLGLRLGAQVGPSGETVQLGLGGNDILGRLNWVALGSATTDREKCGPAGAMIGAAWRGWAWSPSLHVFSFKSHETAQKYVGPAAFDTQRQGAEVGLHREWMPRYAFGSLRWTLCHEQLKTEGKGLERTYDHQFTGLDLNQGVSWNRGKVALSSAIHLNGQMGRSQGENWSRMRGGLMVHAVLGDLDLKAEAETGKMGGNPQFYDLYQLGGSSQPLMGRSLEAAQVHMSALPVMASMGNRFETAKISSDGFYASWARVWQDGAPKPRPIFAFGWEIKLEVEKLPFMERSVFERLLGKLELSMGVHRVQDKTLEKGSAGRTRNAFTFGLGHRF